MPEIRTAYLFAAKIATIFETTKFVAHNFFLFNVSAILPKKIRDCIVLKLVDSEKVNKYG